MPKKHSALLMGHVVSMIFAVIGLLIMVIGAVLQEAFPNNYFMFIVLGLSIVACGILIGLIVSVIEFFVLC